VLSHSSKAKTWFYLNVQTTAEAIGEPRGRIVTALNYLEEQGDLVLKATGARLGYRRTAKPWDGKKLAEKLVARFADRERRDVERLHQVLQLAEQPGCITRALMEYFGDPAEGDCGHCGRCKGVKPTPLPNSAPAGPGERDRAVIREVMAPRHAALASPRQMTRHLCGLTSPQSSRAKLTKEKTFGALAAFPFREVLAAVEAEMGGG
jgi:ATP-dependent DNA helicase RecQ